MNWEDFAIYLAAVRAGSYAGAAGLLGINRTTVGRRVQALEEAVGEALFEQTSDGDYTPTAAGRRLLATAAAMEREVEAFRAGASYEGVVRIAGSAGIAHAFLNDIGEIASARDGLSIEIIEEVDPVAALTGRRADLGLALVRVPPVRLAGEQVGVVRHALYGSAKLHSGGQMPATGGFGATPGELPLGWGAEVNGALPRQWTQLNAPGRVRFNRMAALHQAVRDGIGTGWLWSFAADDDPELIRLRPPDSQNDVPLWLLHRNAPPPGPGLALMLGPLAERLRARLR